MSLSPCGIEYVINPDGTPGVNWRIFTGCENWHNGVCGGGGQDFFCWAKRLAEGRLKRFYPYGFEPTFYPEQLRDPEDIWKHQTIAVSFMGDLFGDWPEAKRATHSESPMAPLPIKIESMDYVRQRVIGVVWNSPQHTFLFLTKCPWNLPKCNPWPGKAPWPDNAFVGATATDSITFAAAYFHLAQVQARHKYISLEPLLNWDLRTTEPMIHQASQAGVSWVIIGAMTGSKAEIICLSATGRFLSFKVMPYGNKWSLQPPVSWVREIEAACDREEIKLWLKLNLRPLLGCSDLRQELPETIPISY